MLVTAKYFPYGDCVSSWTAALPKTDVLLLSCWPSFLTELFLWTGTSCLLTEQQHRPGVLVLFAAAGPFHGGSC